MVQSVSPLMIQFLESLASRPLPYADVMEGWRTSCPRLSIWEDAVLGGFVQYQAGGERLVSLTPRGRSVLDQAAGAPALVPVPDLARVG